MIILYDLNACWYFLWIYNYDSKYITQHNPFYITIKKVISEKINHFLALRLTKNVWNLIFNSAEETAQYLKLIPDVFEDMEHNIFVVVMPCNDENLLLGL